MPKLCFGRRLMPNFGTRKSRLASSRSGATSEICNIVVVSYEARRMGVWFPLSSAPGLGASIATRDKGAIVHELNELAFNSFSPD